jgi:hypothetical protein
MDSLIKLLLILLYPLLLLGRGLNALFGRDPLRLRQPTGSTFWIARAGEPEVDSYFSEASSVEGCGHGGMGGAARGCLRGLARMLAPPRPAPGEKFSAAADREQGIPDEVYTLW